MILINKTKRLLYINREKVTIITNKVSKVVIKKWKRKWKIKSFILMILLINDQNQIIRKNINKIMKIQNQWQDIILQKIRGYQPVNNLKSRVNRKLRPAQVQKN